MKTIGDEWYKTSAAKYKKKWMMGMSSIQFKHIDKDNNYYLPGKDVLAPRLAQVMQMQPDMLQIQSWNDAGESHNMGLAWNEAIPKDSANANSKIRNYQESE